MPPFPFPAFMFELNTLPDVLSSYLELTAYTSDHFSVVIILKAKHDCVTPAY